MSGFSSRTLIRGKLALESRSWTLKDGTTQSAFRIRIRQKKVKQYAYITCESQTENAAIQEAHEKFSEYQSSLRDGRDIRESRRRLPNFVSEFLSFHDQRVKNGAITELRLHFLRHHLKTLNRFWEVQKKPDIERLCELIDYEWHKWRQPQKTINTKRPLSSATRKAELNDIRQFYLWLREKGLVDVVPKKPDIKVEHRGTRFPAEYYRKVLRAAAKSSRNGNTPRLRYIYINYYHLILLLYGTGMRVLESRNLRWTDISKDGEDTLLYLHGKNKERTIQVPPRIAFYLNRLRNYKKEQDPDYDDQVSFVFSDYGSMEPPKKYNAQVLREWCENAGMPQPLRSKIQFTSFRHDFVSRSLINGVDSLSIAKYVGSSQRMIERVYSHLLTRPLYEIIHKGTPEDALRGRQTTPKFMDKGKTENPDP